MVPNREDLIQYRIQRAKETIDDAKLTLENNRLHSSANRIYYAIFYIVSALALKNEFSTSKHHQLFGWFNKNFIHNGKIPVNIGEIYKKAFDNRQESDYEDFIHLDAEELKKSYEKRLSLLNM